MPRLPRIPQLDRLPRMPRVPRKIARAPVPLYLHGLGFLFGHRLVLVEHKGRLSGRLRQVVLEVVDRGPRRIVVVSGYGPKAHWYRNLLADPRVRITTGGMRDMPAVARPLTPAETLEAFARYRDAHPAATAALASAFGVPELAANGPLDPAIAVRMPMVEFAPRDHP
jgi:deazaflavin-dependent oxidoreductase (nitroreductase family)